MPYCKKCGNSIREGAGFCRGCGAKIAEVSPAGIPVAPKPVLAKLQTPSRLEPIPRVAPVLGSVVRWTVAACILLLVIATTRFMIVSQQKKTTDEDTKKTGGVTVEEKFLHAPSLVGLTEAEAWKQIAATDRSLRLVVAERAHHNTIPIGQIVSQKSPPDSKIASGTALEVIVSKGPAPELLSAQITTVIDHWTKAQTEGDFAAYRACYANSFIGIKRTPPRGITSYSYNAWFADRKKMFAHPQTVLIKNLIFHTSGAVTQASFDQYYFGNNYADWGPKTLTFDASLANGLKIVHEELKEAHKLTVADRKRMGM